MSYPETYRSLTTLRCTIIEVSHIAPVVHLSSFSELGEFSLSFDPDTIYDLGQPLIYEGLEADIEMEVIRPLNPTETPSILGGRVLKVHPVLDLNPGETLAAWRAWFAPHAEAWEKAISEEQAKRPGISTDDALLYALGRKGDDE